VNAAAAGPVVVGVLIGAGVALAAMRVRLSAPPRALLRINVSGREVPAVLGDSVVVGGLAGVVVIAFAAGAGWSAADVGRTGIATAVLLVALGAAGRFDDLRGDEAARGFGGHLRAARAGTITGGLVKIIVGGVAGLVAGGLVADGISIVLTGMAIALAANLFNLLDRAPGRAGKLWLIVAAPVFVIASNEWAAAAAGTLGALLAILPADLAARGMLGDAGANPLGAVWGLGLATALSPVGIAAAIGVLLLLNLASERWSFSRAIERTPMLRALDQLGRK
jgi:UDP-GlcNAc:undecaprenyl-phosphate/decaprenyl-phosphate GlcNAc-1-phosphate transferase